MPNVEIHGLMRDEATVVREKIFSLFGDTDYVDDMVVTIFWTEVQDKNGDEQPFLRLANSKQAHEQDHTEEILDRLKTLGMDIEQLRLEAFFPAPKDPP